MANTKYSSIKNDYTIIFDRNSVIEPAKDDAKIKSQGFSFVNLEEINGFEQQRTVDIAGVILTVGPVSLFQPKDATRPAKDKRSLTLADDTGHQMQLTLWGKNATRCEFKEGRVLAIKGAKVSEYGGKSLNAGDEHSQLFLEPPVDKRCEELRRWYDTTSPDQIRAGSSMTASRDVEDKSQLKPDNFKLIRELIDAVQSDQSLQ